MTWRAMRRLAACAAAGALLAGVVAGADARQTSGDYIVVLERSAGAPGRVAQEHARAYGVRPTVVYRHALRGYGATIPPGQVEALSADPRVKLVERDARLEVPDRVFREAAASPGQRVPSGIERIEGPLSTTVAGDGAGAVDVNVAVIDSGVDLHHEDLNASFGKNCSGDGNRGDPLGHGTFVAGVIGALDNDRGVVGVAPGANIWSVKSSNRDNPGFASMAKVICGVDWVTSTLTDEDPENDIDVVNLSWGDYGLDGGACGLTGDTRPGLRVLHQAICRSTRAGATYVVAAGNAALDVQRQAPGNFEEVLNVTAMVDQRGSRRLRSQGFCYVDEAPAAFTNFATRSDDLAHTLAAPGACVRSTVPPGIVESGYARADGTSFAAPHVAGAVALCIDDGPCAGLAPQQIVEKMVADAAAYTAANPEYGFLGDPLRTEGPCDYGYLISARQWSAPSATAPSADPVIPTPGTTPASGALRCQSGEQLMLVGTAAGERLIGGKGVNSINALGGRDRIRSGPAWDLLWGGRGADRIQSGAGADVVEGGRLGDLVASGRAGDIVYGGTGNDVLKLGRGDDLAGGESGADELRGGRGGDVLRGGPGPDKLFGGPGDDTFLAGDGDRCFDDGQRIGCG